MIEGGDMDERLSECANVMLSDDVVNEFKELFEVVENDNFDYYAVKLSKGEYVDVVYKYGSIEPEETEDRLNIQFEYNVLLYSIHKRLFSSIKNYYTNKYDNYSEYKAIKKPYLIKSPCPQKRIFERFYNMGEWIPPQYTLNFWWKCTHWIDYRSCVHHELNTKGN